MATFFEPQTGTANPFDGLDVGTRSIPTLADVDSDGDLDAVVGAGTGILNYFENTGSAMEANFTQRTGTANPFDGLDVGTSSAPTLADVDGDGDLDAVVGESDGSLNYFENTGSATEANFIQRTGTANPFDGLNMGTSSKPALADVDGDGDLDAVVGDIDGILNYFENAGSATEASFIQRTGTANPFDGLDVGESSAPTLADVDGDGDLDAVVGESDGSLNYFENTGSTTEASFIQRTGTANPFDGFDVGSSSAPTLADVDGDGDPDAVVGEFDGVLNYVKNTTPIANTQPTVDAGIANQSATEDSAFTLAVPADAFADGDAGDALTLTATLATGDALPAWLSFDGTTFSGTPLNEHVGTISIRVTATDLAGETATTPFAIAIANTNDAPTVAAGISNQTAMEDSAFTFAVPADAFEDVDAGDDLAYTATLDDGTDLPAWLSFDGTTFSGTPENDNVGTLSIRVTATDFSGETATTPFAIAVTNTNDDPTVDAGIANQSATEDIAFSFDIPTDAFADEDVGDDLTLTATLANGDALPAWLSFDGTTFSGTPLNEHVGTIAITVTATDNAGGKGADTFELAIANRPPITDFNGDLNVDIVARDLATGEHSILNIDDATFTAVGALPTDANPNWFLQGIGDFDQDGDRDDLLWHNDQTGNVETWNVDSPTLNSGVQGYFRFGAVHPTTGWLIQGVGDFDGDDYIDDLLWFNRATGDVALWMTEDGAVNEYLTLGGVAVDSGWTVAEVGDFDGDGLADDLLWRNGTTGDNGVWIVEDGRATDYVGLAPVADLAWQIIGVSDFDSSGQTNDILWRNDATGMVAVWLLDDTNAVVNYLELGTMEAQIQVLV